MRLRPDFDSTATGYLWLDRLTFPYWRFRVWYEHRKFVSAIEQVDEWIDALEDAQNQLNDESWHGAIELDNMDFDDDYDGTPWGTESYLEPWTPEPPDKTRPRDERP